MVTKDSLIESKIESTGCWFASVVPFLKAGIPSNIVSSSSSLDRPKFEMKESGAENEFCCVQWFDIVGESILPVDQIDAVLKCLRLRRQETLGQNNLLLSREK